jgi:hypothetical protein
VAAQGGPPTFSSDGYWWWDGAAWQPAISPDRRWRWDGRAWIAMGEARPRSGLSTGALVAIIAAMTVVVLVVVSVMAYVGFSRVGNQSSGGVVPTAGGVPCDQLEHTQVHYHVVLQIIHEGVQTALPGGIGIEGGEILPTCFYWLHVHSFNQNVIHVESPANETFTLSQFFSVWNAWSTNKGGPREPLDATHISSFTLTPSENLYVYFDAGDGKGAQLFTGDPGTIVLKAHEVISLEITSGQPTTPPGFDWSAPGNAGL